MLSDGELDTVALGIRSLVVRDGVDTAVALKVDEDVTSFVLWCDYGISKAHVWKRIQEQYERI
jgi:hypothetical protein